MSDFAVPIPFEVVDGKKVMRRSNLWRLNYRVRRYMSYLTDDELNERNQDVFANLATLTPEGKIGLPPVKDRSFFPWMELWAHVMEEHALRGHGLPSSFIRGVQLPIPTKVGLARGTKELQKRRLVGKGKLIKYGKEEHLKEAFETGRWRVAPASTYSNDPCRARQDSELELSYRVPYFKQDPHAQDQLDETRPDALIKVRNYKVRSATDFYTVCLARSFVHRLFDDFTANACLIVTNEEQFTARMFKAFAEFRPLWSGESKRVDYVDPILPSREPDVFFAKHFRYAYQDEFRFVWKPLRMCAKLEPTFIDLGSLKDCCEFFSEEQINQT